MDFIKNAGLNSGFCYKALISVELLARVIDIRLGSYVSRGVCAFCCTAKKPNFLVCILK